MVGRLACVLGLCWVLAAALPGAASAAQCTPLRLDETSDVTSLWAAVRGRAGAVQGAIVSGSGRVRATTAPGPVGDGGTAFLPFPAPVRLIPGDYCLRTQPVVATGAAALLFGAAPAAAGASDVLGFAATVSAGVAAARPCTKHAATTGNDGADGTAARPYRTVGRMLRALRPGQTGCLIAGGTFVESVEVTADGITLKTSPASAEPARFRGRIQWNDSADDGWIDNLRYDIYNADFVPGDDHGGLKVYGDRFSLTNSEVFSSRPAASGICAGFGYEFAGDPDVGYAEDVHLARNRFHDCGTHEEVLDHAVYLDLVRGALVEDNVFYDNRGGWGVHLYPDADDVTVRHNTIDGGGPDGGGGIIVAGNEQLVSSDARIENNVLANPGVRRRPPPLGPYAYHNLETTWDGRVGTGNVADGNCLHSTEGRNVRDQAAGGSLRVTRSVLADPLFVDRARGDFRLRQGSPCAGKGVRGF